MVQLMPLLLRHLTMLH